jgi:LacI family transcriptional regulator
MATIQEVARRARVSPATVSRVLNGNESVHPDLVLRVRDAVAGLGYQPNGMARNLRRSESTLWAVVVSDVSNPFFTSMVRGVEDIAQDLGYSVVLCNSDESRVKEAGYLAAAVADRMAGVIISPASTPETDVSGLISLGIPVVAVDRRVDGAAVDTVLVDNERAARLATGHLLDMGYRRIGCITGPRQAMTASERLAGYTAALSERGIDPRPDLVRHADFRQPGGYAAMTSLLGESRPDAVFIANNLMTVGAIECLFDRRIEIPREMGLVGFDEPPWASLIRPSLSTVAQPTYQMGRVAGELLAARRGAGRGADSGRPPETIVLHATLNVRASSTSLAASRQA